MNETLLNIEKTINHWKDGLITSDESFNAIVEAVLFQMGGEKAITSDGVLIIKEN